MPASDMSFEYKQTKRQRLFKHVITALCFGLLGGIGVFGFVQAIHVDGGFGLGNAIGFILLPVLLMGVVLLFIAAVSLLSVVKTRHSQDLAIVFDGTLLSWQLPTGESFAYPLAEITCIEKRVSEDHAGSDKSSADDTYYLHAQGEVEHLSAADNDVPVAEIVDALVDAGIRIETRTLTAQPI